MTESAPHRPEQASPNAGMTALGQSQARLAEKHLAESHISETPAAIAIGLGSNLGHSSQTLQQALIQLNDTPGITIEKASSFYRTRPIGPPQPDYVNACALLNSTLQPLELLHCLQAVEQHFNRVRKERWGPRTLDLDILLWGDRQLHHPNLQIPHPHMAERGFVLIPLAEIAPNWRHPVLQQSIQALCQGVDCSDVEMLSSA